MNSVSGKNGISPRQPRGLFLYCRTVAESYLGYDDYKKQIEDMLAKPDATKEEIIKLQIRIMNATNVQEITYEVMRKLLQMFPV